MKLSILLTNVEHKALGSINHNVSSLCHIAQKATKNSIFFSLKGKVHNGNDWAQEAIDNGCRIIVTETSLELKKNITQIIVPDCRKAMSQIASNFYGNPSKKLKIVGVTGTNGKTTTTNMIAHILAEKHSVAVVGTNGVKYANKNISAGLTTPDPIDLQKMFADMVSCGVEYCIMEMSAHAIYLQKLWGIYAEIVAFSNLSQDHLDYFENMENYFAAKSKLFEENNYHLAVVCTDTEYGKRLVKVCKNCVTCSSISTDADIFISNVTHTTNSQTFVCNCDGEQAEISINLLGKFNLQNAILAISVCKKLGIDLQQISSRFLTFAGVAGRFESYQAKNCTIIVDYAHTPDGLYNLLATARELAKGKLICVFGCGGNRDADKRPIMASVAEKFADYTIVTTDNPRFEDNYQIAKDICAGFSKKKWEVILDRGQAFRTAVYKCRKGDVVVLAGKGAETYMEISGTKVDFSDKELVKRVIAEN